MGEKKTIGIVAKNSVSFVKEILNSYQKNHIAVLLRDVNDIRIELTSVSEVIEPDDSKGWFVDKFNLSCENSLAQISFTSGTEGEPKGVLLTHRALADTTERLNDIMEIDSSIREYVGVPANFSFGLGRFRAVAAVGGCSYLPEYGFNPVEIKKMLEVNEINAVSAVPSLWRVLLKNKSIFGAETANLKWIEIGSQYMSRKEKEELKLLFPAAVIVQHYGLTEASRTTFLRIDRLSGEKLESVGTVYGQTEIKISENGRICIKGPHVAETILKGEVFTSNIDGDKWFQSNDYGRIEGGYLYYQGRVDDLINYGGIKLSPDALEREICEYLGIKEGIAIACIDDELAGNGVLVVSLDNINIEQQDIINASLRILSGYGINNKSALKTLELNEYPITGTGKIKRKELAELFFKKNEEIKKLDNEVENTVKKAQINSLTKDEQRIQLIWQSVLKVEHLDIDSSFYELGGDSLTVIGALITMENRGVPAEISKGMLQGFTIREIAKKLSDSGRNIAGEHEIKSPELQITMTINIIRGLLVLIVVMAHWYHGAVERISEEYVASIKTLFQPIFSMGTPGFSIIYGIGVGYSLYSMYLSDPVRVKFLLRKTFIFLLLGVGALGLVRVIANYNEIYSGSYKITSAFNSVLLYFLAATVTMRFWFKFISYSKHTVSLCFLLAISLYSIHVLFISNLSVLNTQGVLELLKLMLTGKYAYFLMLSGTIAGVGVGIYCVRALKDKKGLANFTFIGISCIILGLILTSHVENPVPWTKEVSTNYLWRWILYFGVILIFVAILEQLLAKYNSYTVNVKFIFQFFSVIGTLAFPIFVLHEMVIPLKAIFLMLSGSEIFSLLTSLAVFFSIIYVFFRKIHRFSYL